MIIVFITVYFVIALACVGLGLYLSQPGKSWATLKDDAFNVFPVKYRSPVQSAQPTPSPCLDDIHAHQVADAFDVAIEHRAMPTASAEPQSEPEPAEANEVIHDEP